ncbi:MAG: acyl carrier protein [Deltaproteobacteria bacterium]|nr:acyl carrier protein [Deltaproteobacteria bacterium]
MENKDRQLIMGFITTQIAKKKEHREIGEEDDLITSGIIDSLGIMHLIGFLESTFGIRIPDEDFVPENFSSVKAIASFVSRGTAH